MYINSSLFTVQKKLHSYKNINVLSDKMNLVNGCELESGQYLENAVGTDDLTDQLLLSRQRLVSIATELPQ